MEKMLETSKVFVWPRVKTLTTCGRNRMKMKDRSCFKRKMKNVPYLSKLTGRQGACLYLSALSSNGNFNYLQIAAINGKSIPNEQQRNFHLKSQDSVRWQDDFRKAFPSWKQSYPQRCETWKKPPKLFSKIPQSGVGSSTGDCFEIKIFSFPTRWK